MWSDDVARVLDTEVDDDGSRPVVDVAPSEWHPALLTAKTELGCDFFDWLSAVDEGPDGLRLVAHVWSLDRRRGLLIRCLLGTGQVESIVDVYAGAAWHERETHEMFGIDFRGHPNLSPLLLAPEFDGHPLRKNFVLASRVAKPWPGAKEPGGGGARKRAPMRPPGVPAPGEWGPSTEEDGA